MKLWLMQNGFEVIAEKSIKETGAIIIREFFSDDDCEDYEFTDITEALDWFKSNEQKNLLRIMDNNGSIYFDAFE